MADIPPDIPVSVFDPALPFERVLILDAGVDTWHEHILITRGVLVQLPHIEEHLAKGVLEVSGGMSIQVPVVTIGIKIGGIEIPEVSALVLDHGVHELLLGSSIFHELFRLRARDAAESSGGEPGLSADSDPDELRVQLYPVTSPFDSKKLENFLMWQRQLYNISLIALGQIKVSGLDPKVVDAVIEEDEGIPDHLRLKISSVESGSVVVALKSGCKDALKRLSSIFEKGASARLAQELAEASDVNVRAGISKETREATALEIRLEKEKLSTQNIHETYRELRVEAREKLVFLNDLIRELGNPALQEELKRKKDHIILEMANQMLVPIVRHVPDAHSTLRSGVSALPPAPDENPKDAE